MRFTKKSDKLGYCLRHSSIKTWQCWDKLGQLEDIEDELGIDLITLFKALKEGVYTKLHRHKDVVCVGLSGLIVEIDEVINEICYYTEYGKTWALTKKELEK